MQLFNGSYLYLRNVNVNIDDLVIKKSVSNNFIAKETLIMQR